MNPDQLLRQLNGSDEKDCEAAAIKLGEMGELVLPHLTVLLDDANSDARFWAVRALWTMGTPTAIEAIISTLNDPDEMVRSGAALALGELKTEVATGELARLLREETGSTGNHAADALSKIGEPAAAVLIEAMSDSRTWVRIRAARSLVAVKSQDAIPTLFQALEDNSYVVRHYAEEALAQMGVGQMVYFRP